MTHPNSSESHRFREPLFLSRFGTREGPSSLSPPAMYEAQVSIALFLLLASIAAAPVAGVAATALGLDTFLASEYRRDPSASADSFSALPASLKRSLAATLPPSDHAALVSDLLSYRISVPVYVKLVGSFSSAAPALLRSFAAATLASDRFHVIGAAPHHLAVGHTLHLDPSQSTLGSKISDAIRSQIESSTSPLYRSAFLSVPYSTVDRIIEQDFQKENSNSAPGFYIYLLNLGSQSKPYAYSVDSRDSSLAFTKCLGTLWAGKERYVWIDLAAGPVDYGPAIAGEGVISRSEFHPLAAGHGRPRSERSLLSDLTSLVLSAYKALLVPSLRIPVFYQNSLLIQFIHVHGADPVKDGLDWSLIQQTLKESELAYKEQSLEFKSYSVRFSDCPICSFAITRSMSSYTSRFLFENYTLIVSEYLDSKRLHQILLDSVEEVRRAVRIPEEDHDKVLPVYVFDLDYDKLLLLDRYHQSVAFRNMVVAVRTKSSQTVSDYSCNGRHVITQTRSLDRPVIGSVLQSMWGVSPTHQTWSLQHNATMVDYAWSVGQTPFGPFSDSLSLSFAQRDAARRNVLLTALNYTITSAIDVLQSMAAHGGERKLLEDHNKHVEFVQRWNLLRYKLEKVVSAVSQFDFEKAMYFMRSSDHDLYAIHTLVYEASQKLEASLVCFKDPPLPWVSLSLFGVFLFGFSYVYAKKDKVFKSKRKQF